MMILILFSLYNFFFKMDLETRFIFSKDLDGDPKKELILLHPGKKISILSLSENNFKPLLKSSEISKEGVIIDFGEFYPELKGEEIFIARQDGIDIFKFNKDNIILLKSFQFSNSPIYPKSKDLKKGKIFYEDKLIFFYPEKGILIDKNGNFDTIEVMIERDISTDEDKGIYEIPKKSLFKTSYILPFLFFEDINGDGSDDLVEYSRDSLFIFFKKNNKFSSLKDISIDLSFLKSEEEKAVFAPNVFVIDINNDKKADLLFIKSGEIIFGTKSIIYLFLNHDGKFKNVPDQVLVSESSFPDIRIIDLNNDGNKDLITNVTPFNIWRIIKLLLTKKDEITYGFYLFKNGFFSKTPNFTKKFGLRVDVEKKESEGEIDIFDFDRDNFYDIIYFKKDELIV
ncbi:MAG: VCBS repeat-containing protein, partial [bacterium]|nr:VCBS repeat-containing protein [bacterium]MDW8163454.1 VCBS repeat-containing protein [Candidatus Omnitrophota bacterium]